MESNRSTIRNGGSASKILVFFSADVKPFVPDPDSRGVVAPLHHTADFLRHRRRGKSHTYRKGKRGKPLTEQAKGRNRTKSTVRVRVENVFGARANNMGSVGAFLPDTSGNIGLALRAEARTWPITFGVVPVATWPHPVRLVQIRSARPPSPARTDKFPAGWSRW